MKKKRTYVRPVFHCYAVGSHLLDDEMMGSGIAEDYLADEEAAWEEAAGAVINSTIFHSGENGSHNIDYTLDLGEDWE